MAWIIVVIVVGLLMIGLRMALPLLCETPTEKKVSSWIIYSVGGFILLISTAIGSIHQVPVGHIGLVYQFGDIVDQREAGFQLTYPWQSVKNASVKIQEFRYEGDKRLTTASLETQDVFVAITVNYRVDKTDIQDLYSEVGPNYYSAIIEPRINQLLKDETARYRAVDIIPERQTIRSNVRSTLTEEMREYSIEIIDLLLVDISYTNEFARAIEEKQVATQDALREEERIRQAEAEGSQRVAAAEADARAAVARANGEAEANRIISESLTEEVLTIRALEALGDNIEIALIPSGQGIIIDPSTLLGDK